MSALLTEWARLLVGSLRRAGLREVVLSPGSRSTPFTWAALQEPGLSCRSIIDERSAAFYALGHARITGEPVLLVCTSGSAAANYYPAVVEAAESGTPLLVLTADRPLELQQAAAPQTIDQVRLYGHHARAFFDLGTPDPDPRMLRAIPRIAAQALRATRAPIPGPVHLNARARKPLEPRGPESPEDHAIHDLVRGLLDRTPAVHVPRAHPDPDAIAATADACVSARRGLIVCGPAAAPDAPRPGAVTALARASGFPVVAEAASQIRFADADGLSLDTFPALLEVPGFIEGHRPDLVLQVGRPPTASAWHAAMDRWEDVDLRILARSGWPDPWGRATAVVAGDLDASLMELARALEDEPVDGPGEDGGRHGERADWRDRLLELDRRGRALTDAALDGPFSEGAAVRAVVDALPRGAVLALGNSLPIREVDRFVPPGDRGLTVWSQRGANGIDGLVSGAAGAAAAAGRPTTLLLGDVSFAHDIGGLRTLRALPAPLTVVVLDNGGGRIFERLPIAGTLADDPALEAWLTPPGVDVEAATAAFGLPFARADDRVSLAAGLATLRDTGGVLQVVIPDEGTTRHQDALRRRLAAELG
jgi:2-succinyl-5-enolpyruvyl-6-hydroxy-3-cyclohexene-1-carboxylate synthase